MDGGLSNARHAKYMSQVCKLAVRVNSKTACFIKYFAGNQPQCWWVYTLPNMHLWAWELSWFNKVQEHFWNRYDLQNETPATLANHCKMQKVARARDRLSPMGVLFSNS